uniref:Uncharacterized protein n=1 Tax=Staphylococcus aureus TaxID=1280 RepID=D2JF73_STAAU|nr:hypothetical protein SAP091A_012 [Staphylococcus aureus]
MVYGIILIHDKAPLSNGLITYIIAECALFLYSLSKDK